MTDDKAADNANAGQKDEWDGLVDDVDNADSKDKQAPAPDSSEDAKKALQREKSDLGRKVKDQGEKLEKLAEQNQTLIDTISRLEAHLTGQDKKSHIEVNPNSDMYDQMVAVAGEPPVEFVTTPRESYLYRQWEAKAMGILQESNNKVYRESYLTTLNTLKDMGGDNHAEVVKLVTTKNSPFNIYRNTGRGDVDARMNYLEAFNSLIKDGKVSFGKSNVKGSGVSQGSSSDVSSGKTVNLTEDAKAYAKFLGMSEEDISASMKRHVGRIG